MEKEIKEQGTVSAERKHAVRKNVKNDTGHCSKPQTFCRGRALPVGLQALRNRLRSHDCHEGPSYPVSSRMALVPRDEERWTST
mmetsp:Transcript_16746/g.29213  ORF Transcript_16746/g.29213 Transcript_16746/m.29213 type:complete len:84 (+) Transcript_16746:147-398(+)